MIEILFADDHEIVRRGLKQIVMETDDIVVTGEASNGHEMLTLFRECTWDVVLLDLTKSSAPEELVAAIRKAAQGCKYITTQLAEKLANNLSSTTIDPPHEALSDREYQAMLMLASEQTVSEIAADLNLSANTISTNRYCILKKMNMRTNADLTYYAFKNQLL